MFYFIVDQILDFDICICFVILQLDPSQANLGINWEAATQLMSVSCVNKYWNTNKDELLKPYN